MNGAYCHRHLNAQLRVNRGVRLKESRSELEVNKCPMKLELYKVEGFSVLSKTKLELELLILQIDDQVDKVRARTY